MKTDADQDLVDFLIDGDNGSSDNGSSEPREVAATLETEPTVMINPITQTMVELDSIDSILGHLSYLKELINGLQSFDRMLRNHAVKLVEPGVTANTRHLIGLDYNATITMPSEHFNNSLLVQLWKNNPGSNRDLLLRVTAVGVNLREYKKLLKAGIADKQLREMVEAVTDANEGPQGIPQYKIVEKQRTLE